PLQRKQSEMIADIGDEEFSGGDEPVQVFENLLPVDRIEFQQQVCAEVVNPAKREQLALKCRESRQHSLACLPPFEVIADQAVEELNRVFAAHLQFPRG